MFLSSLEKRSCYGAHKEVIQIWMGRMRFSLFHTWEQNPSRQSPSGLVDWHHRQQIWGRPGPFSPMGLGLGRPAVEMLCCWLHDGAQMKTLAGGCSWGWMGSTWGLGWGWGFWVTPLGRLGSIWGVGGMGAEQQKNPVTRPVMRFSIRESCLK